MASLNRVDIFNRLQPFYLLIYVHNLQDYSLEDLNGLALRLQGKLDLDQQQKQIHQKLLNLSQENYNEKKLSRKKAKNAINESSFLKGINNSIQNNARFDSFSIEQSMIYNDNNDSIQNWAQKAKFSGVIYDGRLQISLHAKYKEKNQKIQFQVQSRQKVSSISVSTLEKFNKTDKLKIITLQIAQRKHNFEVYGTRNIIGLDFLNQQKVVINCNYRPQIHKFTFAFTS